MAPFPGLSRERTRPDDASAPASVAQHPRLGGVAETSPCVPVLESEIWAPAGPVVSRGLSSTFLLCLHGALPPCASLVSGPLLSYGCESDWLRVPRTSLPLASSPLCRAQSAHRAPSADPQGSGLQRGNFGMGTVLPFLSVYEATFGIRHHAESAASVPRGLAGRRHRLHLSGCLALALSSVLMLT